MKKLRTDSAESTVNIGVKLGNLLGKGDVVCLSGDLGTGKTALTNGIAKALGVEGYITSPTFTIVNEYMGRERFYHFDVYRINAPEEMFEIGFDEYLQSGGIVVIEWAELIKDILPDERIWVTISKDLENGADSRVISIDFAGDKYRDYEKQFTMQ